MPVVKSAAPKINEGKTSEKQEGEFSSKIDRDGVDESIEWVLSQCREIRDELDAGMFLNASSEHLTELIKDWKSIQKALMSAYGACTAVVDELKAWKSIRNDDKDIKPLDTTEDDE